MMTLSKFTLSRISAAAALLLAAGAAHAQTTTPGYDRPSADTANRPHQHVVYWNDSMDHYDIDMQVAADAYSVYDLPNRNDRKEMDHYNKHHPQQKSDRK